MSQAWTLTTAERVARKAACPATATCARVLAPRSRKEQKQRPESDQVIRENPASRGTETSAEVLVGPPLGAGGWSETPVNSSGTRLTLTLDGGLEGPPRPVMAPYPFPSASSVGVGRRRGSTWVRQFSPP